MTEREWAPWELRMTTDYLIAAHPTAKHYTRVRLGPLPDEARALEEEGISRMLYMVALHWADGVALYDNKAVVLEVKVKLHSTALGQILTNMTLFTETEQFQHLEGIPTEGEVVYAYGDKETLRMLDIHGIKAVKYRPAYIKKYYLEQLQKTYKPRPGPTRSLYSRLFGGET